MAAIIEIHHWNRSYGQEPEWSPGSGHAGSPGIGGQSPANSSARPNLVVIDGGSLAALRRRQAPAVYRRRRLVATAMVLAVGLFAVLSVRAVLPAGAGPAAAPAEQPSVVVVQPGDSIWSLAEKLGPVGDVRRTVEAIREANGGSSVLRVGQRIAVPVRGR